MLRVGCYSLPIVLLFSAVSSGQVQLKHKLTPGVVKQEQISKVTQTLTIAGMETKSESESITTSKETFGKRDNDNKIRSESTIESIQISVKANGAEYLFDSANPDKKGDSPLEVLRPAHQAVAKAKTVYIYGKDDRVEKAEFDEQQLEGIPDQIKALIKTTTDVEYLKKVANADIDRVPGKSVKKGDSWEVSQTVDFGGGQLMTFETKYTYEGVAEKDGKKLDKISSKVSKVDFEIKDGPLPIALKSHELKPKESNGEYFFDRKAGRFTSSKSTVVVAGKLVFEANGVALPGELELTMKTSSNEK